MLTLLINHRDPTRISPRHLEEPPMKTTPPTTNKRGARIPGNTVQRRDAVATNRQLSLRNHRRPVGSTIPRDRIEPRGEGGEHGINGRIIDDVLAHIPVHAQATAEHRDLTIDEDSRPLRHDPAGRTEDLHEVRPEQLADTDGRSEDDRRSAPFDTGAVEITKHLDARVMAVAQRIGNLHGVDPHLLSQRLVAPGAQVDQ